MAPRRRSKRSPRTRDKLLERQAYASMEIALVEHQEAQGEGLAFHANVQETSEVGEPMNTALAKQLQGMPSSQAAPTKLGEPTSPSQTIPQPSAGPGTDATDLSWFLLLLLLMISLLGIWGSVL